MAANKKRLTLADYLAVAVSPALIMVLVGSLCFFLIEVFYRGQASGGVRWLMFWFVLAVVLIARIGIEQGPAHALGYGLAMAAVSWMYLVSIGSDFVIGAVLLAIVWYSAYKLTVNCTLVDETEDASGLGLFDAARMLESRPAASPESVLGGIAGMAVGGAKPRAAGSSTRIARHAKRAATQSPGVWLIYFSLAALPLFGLGQTLLPAGDVPGRHEGFVHLFCYLAAALGLLITTSFLGLRRYLRQRHLPMPGYVALGWVQSGGVAAGLVLILALLLPRPGATEAWTALHYKVDYRLRQASQYAARFNPHGKGSGRAGDQSSTEGKEKNPSAESDQSKAQGTPADSGGESDQKADSGQKNGQQPSEANPSSLSTERPSPPPHGLPELSGAAGAIYSWLKPLFWLAIIVLAGWLVLFRYREAIWQACQNIWASILKFFADLFGGLGSAEKTAVAVSAPPKVPPFKRFKNPFLTGGDRIWPPEQLIVYSYEALQSWAMDKVDRKGSPLTARELCEQLGAELPEAKTELDHLAYLYGHVVYGTTLPASYDPEKLRRVWAQLASPHQSLP